MQGSPGPGTAQSGWEDDTGWRLALLRVPYKGDPGKHTKITSIYYGTLYYAQAQATPELA